MSTIRTLDWQGVERICAVWSERPVSKSLAVSLDGQILPIVDIGDRRMSLVMRQIHVIQYWDGWIELFMSHSGGRWSLLNYEVHSRTNLKNPEILTVKAKTIDFKLEQLAQEVLQSPNPGLVRYHKEGLRDTNRAKRRERKLNLWKKNSKLFTARKSLSKFWKSSNA